MLIAAAQPSAEQIEEAKKIQPLFGMNDYPRAAARKNHQGSVISRLTVGANGKVKSCRVIVSSKWPELDSKTCEIFLTRARFAPATDAEGNPIEAEWTTPPVRWALPSRRRR